MKQQRELKSKAVSMTYGGPRGTVGQYDDSNLDKLSGTTYGGQGLGWFWQGYPNVIGGLTEYDPQTLMPGSNLSAVQMGADKLAMEAGMADGTATGASVGGTAAY